METSKKALDTSRRSIITGIMVFQDWVKKDYFNYDHPADEGSQGAVIGIQQEDQADLKEAPTQDSNSCPSSDALEHGDTDSSFDDPRAAEHPRRKRDRRRRTILWIGVCCMMILAAAIGVSVALVLSKGSSSDSASSTSEQQQPGSDGEDFDFTDVDAGSIVPNEAPSSQPAVVVVVESTDTPTVPPSTAQSIAPSLSPSLMVTTSAPSKSMVPSDVPSTFPSSVPSFPATLSLRPSGIPSSTPTGSPSTLPTSLPTAPVAPVATPPVIPFDVTSTTLMTFCVIADVPYTPEEADELPNQIATQMEGCEFLVHLGDLFTGDTNCDEEEYLTARDIMMQSTIPTFVVIGDNEWNDCERSRIEPGWELWNAHFLNFHDNWNHTFTVIRQPGYEENFAFIHKRTLVIALNLVGGRVHNDTEWATRLEDEFAWAKSVIDINLLGVRTADGVILMGHAKPSPEHRHFFNPFQDYMENDLANEFPVMYLHGDGHSWIYTPSYENQPNMLRIQHEGGVNEPILKIFADPSLLGPSVYSSFQYDRQIDKFGAKPKPDIDDGET